MLAVLRSRASTGPGPWTRRTAEGPTLPGKRVSHSTFPAAILCYGRGNCGSANDVMEPDSPEGFLGIKPFLLRMEWFIPIALLTNQNPSRFNWHPTMSATDQHTCRRFLKNVIPKKLFQQCQLPSLQNFRKVYRRCGLLLYFL